MNAFSQSARYQDDCEYHRTNTYTPRHSRQSPVRNSASKHTNTPYEFMLCLRCQEKIAKKNQEYASYPVGDCDRNMAEYSKALNYINSCHTIINRMMKDSKVYNDFVRMPDLPNFMELYNSFTNTHKTLCDDSVRTNSPGRKTTHESRYSTQTHEDRSRNNSPERKGRSLSPRLLQNRQQNREDQIRHTTKGKFIDLLPDMKHNKYNKQENFSPGTTESEESDLELSLNIQKSGRIALPSKFKSKLRTTHEKVIYEEDSHEDDSASMYKKGDEKVVPKAKTDITKKKFSPAERSKPIQSSSVSQRNKPPANSVQPMVSNVDSNRKVKQRSSSSTTPREKAKIFSSKKGGASEVAGNFSDTAITAASIVGQTNKFGGKTLCTPIDTRNNELSQQELDKYAKELLGSDSPSPRSPRSKSPVSTFRSTIGDRSKTEQDKNKRFQKSISSPTVKSQTVEQRRKSCQEKQSSNNNGNLISSKQEQQQTQTNSQLQSKRYRKTYANPQTQVEQTPVKKQSCKKSATNNCSNSSSVLTGCVQNQSKSGNNYNFGNIGQQCCVSEAHYARNRCDKVKVTETQEEGSRNQILVRNEDIDDAQCVSPEQLNLLCGNNEMLDVQSRSSAQNGCNNANGSGKVQFSVTTKPHDFFTTNRKNSSVRLRHSKPEIEYDINVESDDIKTDSDIEEDHFEKEEAVTLSRKSSKNSSIGKQMSQVLTHLGLLSNAQLPPEAEQLKNEAKSIRAHDERNRPFREPRKAAAEDPNECIMKIEEGRMKNVYATDSVTQLRRTASDDSSDIKSDEELYTVQNDRPKPVSFDYCLGGARYQT